MRAWCRLTAGDSRQTAQSGCRPTVVVSSVQENWRPTSGPSSVSRTAFGTSFGVTASTPRVRIVRSHSERRRLLRCTRNRGGVPALLTGSVHELDGDGRGDDAGVMTLVEQAAHCRAAARTVVEC